VLLELARAGSVTVQVFDSAGRLVWERDDGVRPPGPREVVWEARDLQGQPIENGVYFVRCLTTGGVSRTVKVHRIR
jgi:hypothetical protein